VTSFFEIKVYVCCIFLVNDITDLRQIFFQGLGENTLLKAALKSNASVLFKITLPVHVLCIGFIFNLNALFFTISILFEMFWV